MTSCKSLWYSLSCSEIFLCSAWTKQDSLMKAKQELPALFFETFNDSQISSGRSCKVITFLSFWVGASSYRVIGFCLNILLEYSCFLGLYMHVQQGVRYVYLSYPFTHWGNEPLIGEFGALHFHIGLGNGTKVLVFVNKYFQNFHFVQEFKLYSYISIHHCLLCVYKVHVVVTCLFLILVIVFRILNYSCRSLPILLSSSNITCGWHWFSFWTLLSVSLISVLSSFSWYFTLFSFLLTSWD